MTRDEWVVLPVAGQVEHRRFRREDIGDYWPRQFPGGEEAVMLMRRHTDLIFTIPLPLAEFEALLFGPAEGDEYTRAAEAWAEASITAQRLWDAVMDGTIADAAAAGEADARVGVCRDAFLRLYRERHDAQR